MKAYPVPAASLEAPHESLLEIRRSRFLAQSFRVADPREARRAVDAVRARHPQASHNCWAFAAGPPGDTAKVGSSDDGEPRGTAGRPILNVLLHGGVGEIAMVVTRWFGGIKLGTGGLARAYQESAQANLDGLAQKIYTPATRGRLILPYARLEAARRLLAARGAKIARENYGAAVELELSLPLDGLEDLRAALAALEGAGLELDG